jgi:hypothetical protein
VSRSILTVTLAASVLLVLAAVGGWSSAAGTGPATIRITDRQVGYTRVDTGRPGISPGDTEVISYRLFNRRVSSTPIGYARFVCTFTVGKLRTCTGTVYLPRGQLVVGGSLRYRSLYEMAVLGGTRLYDNARGTMTAIRTTRRPLREILLFRLTG